MAKVLKICWGPWLNASRDKRELAAYRETGAEVLVLAEGETGDRGRDDVVESFPVKRISSKPFGDGAPKRVNQLSSWFSWAAYARTLKPDIISGHDYIGWLIGWLSVLGRRKKPLFIYDSHEFELGRNIQRNRLRHWLIRRLERFILKKSAFSIMVNDSIADEVQRIYGLQKRPLVVRSTPDNWQVDAAVCRDMRQRLLAKMDKTEGNGGEQPFLVMYHGSLMPDRGIETLIRLAGCNEHVRAVVVGNGDAGYVQRLKNLVSELGVAGRVLFHPAVPLAELWQYVGAADVSLMMIAGRAKSYYYALPNKFFESIQSLTPIIASGFPEMKRLVDQYHIGLTCDPENLEAVNACVEKMRTDTAFCQACKDNLKKAKEELCWEKEKRVLQRAFLALEKASV